jgi:hypothetical protein
MRTLDEEALERHLKEYSEQTDYRKKSQQFRREGYTKLRGLVPESIFAQVVDEVNDLLSQHARRIDIQIQETGGTPRKMHTVSAAEISRDSQLISAIYNSASLKNALGQIADAELLPCPWEGKSMS